MHSARIHLHRPGPLLALLGNPNCGKSALFNRLTGSHQKVANYAGVTVERKEGRYIGAGGCALRVLDLPGVYSLYPRSPDERVTSDVLYGRALGERRPDLLVCVLDATRLRRSLRLLLAAQRTGLPCLLALNQSDRAQQMGLKINSAALSRELGLPVVCTVGTQTGGDAELRIAIDNWLVSRTTDAPTEQGAAGSGEASMAESRTVLSDHQRVTSLLARLGLDTPVDHLATDRIDRVVLHPVAGPALLAAVLFFVFQAVFSWAETPMQWIESGVTGFGTLLTQLLPDSLLRSLLIDGLIAGVGSVLIFLPQILILFFFILVLEETGYLPRAAFLLDRLMGRVGLSGRSFIPLLSSFACAIPGIMATRTIAEPRDRITTILIAPLMTCSARLPVYALLIGAFIPHRSILFGLQLQGLVLFVLYLAGILSAMAVAWSIRRWRGLRNGQAPLMMELPDYHWPAPASVAIGLWQRALIFLRRVGGIILSMSLLLWLLSSFPLAPAGAAGAAIEYSLAGMIGHALAPIFEPVGFDWRICIALVPALAAREVVVSALGTVYALQAGGSASIEQALGALIVNDWSLATGLSLMAWFIFAPQCLATLAAARRETGSWRLPIIMAAYLFSLAWLGALLTYRVALAAGLG